MLTCIEDYFAQIAAFEQIKAEKGLFMSPYAAQEIIEACQIFTENPSENYLIDTFQTRIDSLTDIPEEKKEFYKRQNQSLIELKDRGTNENGLCYLPEGKEYYEHLVRANTGSPKTVKELQQAVERKRNLDMDALHKLLAENPDLIKADDSKIVATEPEAILNHLLTAMEKDFYPAADSSYELNYIHKSLEDTLAPAFYLTAPIDDISHNVIYLNQQNYPLSAPCSITPDMSKAGQLMWKCFPTNTPDWTKIRLKC